MIGGIAKGDWKGAAVGAAAGAVAGGMVGFFQARLSKISDRNRTSGGIPEDTRPRTARDWDIERASVERAYKCYSDQIVALRKAAKAKKIS